MLNPATLSARAAAETARTAGKAAAKIGGDALQALYLFLIAPVDGRPLAGDAERPVTIPPVLLPGVTAEDVKGPVYAVASAFRARYAAGKRGHGFVTGSAPTIVWLSDYTAAGSAVRFAFRDDVPGKAKGTVAVDPATLAPLPATVEEWNALVAQASESARAMLETAFTQYQNGEAVTLPAKVATS